MIEYCFTLDDGRQFDFQIDLPDQPCCESETDDLPGWTALDYEQCRVCTLESSRCSHCPAAVAVAQIVPQFSTLTSVDRVKVQVTTPERIYYKDEDLQNALRSLLGLAMANSGCPLLKRLRGMAHFHLPFADWEDTAFRTTGAYLIQQYLIAQDGGQPDWELKGLRQIYEQLQDLNRSFAKRIRIASDKDAGLNALVGLFSLSVIMTRFLDERMEKFRHLF